MNRVLHRIHFGVMGDALCSVTYGWFCPEVVLYVPDILGYNLYLARTVEIQLEG